MMCIADRGGKSGTPKNPSKRIRIGGECDTHAAEEPSGDATLERAPTATSSHIFRFYREREMTVMADADSWMGDGWFQYGALREQNEPMIQQAGLACVQESGENGDEKFSRIDSCLSCFLLMRMRYH